MARFFNAADLLGMKAAAELRSARRRSQLGPLSGATMAC